MWRLYVRGREAPVACPIEISGHMFDLFVSFLNFFETPSRLSVISMKALLNCLSAVLIEIAVGKADLFYFFTILFRSITKSERNSDESASEHVRNVFQRNFAPDS